VASPAFAADVMEDPAEHAAALAASPGAGVPWTMSFEGASLGTVLTDQLVSLGVEFGSPIGVYVLPEAFGTAGRGSRLAVVGYDPLGQASVTLWFDEPQLAISLWLVDAEGPLQVEAWLGDDLVEAFDLDAPLEPMAGGVYRAIWFDGQVDAVTFRSDLAEDGFGIDDLAIATLGSVDNDGDGTPDGDGDCDDDDPAVFPDEALLCGGVDLDCDGLPEDVDGDGFDPCDGDCDDGDADIAPGQPELCNGVDDDCDGLIDESPDGDADGWTVCEGDCDDDDPDVYPGSGCDPVPGDDDDDDDTGPDDDDTGSDDDDAGSDDDDAGSDDDDAGSDDDDASSDDDDASSDDDDASSDDDDASSDDDDGTPDDPPPLPLPGIAGGGCACETADGSPSALGLALLLPLALRRRRGR